MKKYFNVAGPCIPADHYMIPAGTRCTELASLVEQKLYFVIHAPRQVGKTTLIRDFVSRLNAMGRHLALYCSLETAQGIEDARDGIPVIVAALHDAIRWSKAATDKSFQDGANGVAEAALKRALSDYCAVIDKPLVIMFDEVDCLSQATLLSFLRQLRQGFIERDEVPFVQSLALVGMRNIRDYKAMIRPGGLTLGSASPFNIVTEALTVRNFNPGEIVDLFAQHEALTGQAFPEEVVAEIFYYTNGQPWLCNALAREIVIKILEGDYSRRITLPLVEEAVERIIQRRDTHIDSLLERLKEERVRRVVEPVILGRQVNLDFTNDDARYTFDLGLLSFGKGDVAPANRIYGEVIMRMLTFNSQHQLPNELEGRFIHNGVLDVTALLKEFQQFWRENSDIWVGKYTYKEAAPHLIMQAFLQRVVNSGGRIQREYSAGRGRIDLCVSLAENKYPIELKIRYGSRARSLGIQQLAGYMDTLGASEGWLVIFERDPDLSWEEKITWERLTHQGKTLHIVGC